MHYKALISSQNLIIFFFIFSPKCESIPKCAMDDFRVESRSTCSCKLAINSVRVYKFIYCSGRRECVYKAKAIDF